MGLFHAWPQKIQVALQDHEPGAATCGSSTYSTGYCIFVVMDPAAAMQLVRKKNYIVCTVGGFAMQTRWL